MPDALFVITTLPDREAAEQLATTLVAQGLAACVNISAPVTSIYKWKGQLERGTEVILTIKTIRARYLTLESAIVNGHPYELLEVIAVPITSGLPDYLAWIEACTKN
jgi:periplasmic divalent cation tolerance protein